jgi:hypothetical protein
LANKLPQTEELLMLHSHRLRRTPQHLQKPLLHGDERYENELSGGIGPGRPVASAAGKSGKQTPRSLTEITLLRTSFDLLLQLGSAWCDRYMAVS